MDAKEIALNPTEYGFEWTEREVETLLDKSDKRSGVTLGNIPLPNVTDVTKFAATFPIVAILNRANSITVQAQDIGRKARLADHGAKAEDLKVRVVNGLLGVKSAALAVVTESAVEKFLAGLTAEQRQAMMDKFVNE